VEGVGVRGEITVVFYTTSCKKENMLQVSLLELGEGKPEENCIVPNE
jgi:hypothetical protein